MPLDLDALCDRVGQLFVFGFPGKTLDDDARELLAKDHCSGVILFKRNIDSLEQVVALNQEIHAATKDAPFPPFISVDQEGGRVARLRGICTDVPSMRALGKRSIDDEDLPYRVGAMMARELSALGFHWDFAPVVDVDTNPKNPVIGERAFSSQANEVCHLSSAFVRGMQQAGVAACAKHFPGHGDTDVDSHLALPSLPHDLERLRAVELPPFKATIDAGVSSIMTAHVVFAALDPDRPATMSKKALSILRDELGFEGVIVSDDLEMSAVADRWPVEEIVLEGLRAGVDLFLICHTFALVRRAIAAVRGALRDGSLSPAVVQAALARVQTMKERFIGAPAAPDLKEAKELVRCAPHVELAGRLQEDQDAFARPTSAVDAS